MSSTFLTREEVQELTGARSKATQLRVLRVNGVRFFINRAGWPVVPRSVVDGTPAAAQDTAPAWEPAVLSKAS